MIDTLPMVLAAGGTAALVAGALLALVVLVVARRQIAVRWLRLVGEPADARRARGDVGEALAYATVRSLARSDPDLDLRIFPGRRIRHTELDLVVVASGALWVLECKHWRGRLAAGTDAWVSWSSPRRGAPMQQRRRDPVRQVRAQGETLSRALRQAGLAGVPVREAVVFTDPDVDLDAVRDEGFVLHLDELHRFFRIGPGSQGTPLEASLRDRLIAWLEAAPAWDTLELEGGGRRGRLITEELSLKVGGARTTVPLEEVRQATFRLRGWPVRRVEVSLVVGDDHRVVAGVAADPTFRLWMREPDGRAHPYPLCVLRGFVRGGRGPTP